MSNFIWRFEDSAGLGIYTTSLRLDVDDFYSLYYSAERHPNPEDDYCKKTEKSLYVILMNNSRIHHMNLIFGFENIHQARAWFHDAPNVKSWDYCKRKNQRLLLKAYPKKNTEKAFYGKHQCIFKMKENISIDFPPSHLYQYSADELEKMAEEKVNA